MKTSFRISLDLEPQRKRLAQVSGPGIIGCIYIYIYICTWSGSIRLCKHMWGSIGRFHSATLFSIILLLFDSESVNPTCSFISSLKDPTRTPTLRIWAPAVP